MALLSPAIVLGVVFWAVLYLFSTRFSAWKRLRHIPGPWEVGWSKFWLVRHQFGGRLCLDLEAINKKYGPLARIGPNYVLCSDPDEIRRIWNVRSGYQRAPWYKGYRIDPSNDCILTAIDSVEHHHLKTHVLPGYMGRGQVSQEQVVDHHICKFLDLIERAYLSDRTLTRPMDMGKVMQFLTQDVTSAVEFGESFGYIESNSDEFGAIAALESLQLPCTMLALLPKARALMTSFLFKPFRPRPTDKAGLGKLLGIIQDRVGKRYGDNKAHNGDVIQSFVESPLSQQEVEAEALVHLLGGSDTTATALRNAIFFVATNPISYRRLQAEIDGAVAEGRAARPVLGDAEAKSLPYLQATIKESLRVWPPIMGIMPKVSAKDDIICGVDIPAGTWVAWSPMAIMKNKGIFGGDADVFEPMRWLESDTAQLRKMEATQGLVFMSGTRWECLGRKLAYVELGKTLFELFYRFDFAMINPVEPFKWKNWGFTSSENMNIKITKREPVSC